MPLQFKKPDGTLKASDTCDRNLNILAHAQMIDLDIGSQCGGHGICGGDRIRIQDQSKISPVTEHEKEHLSEREIAQGWRLGCQCFPEQPDLSLLIEIL